MAISKSASGSQTCTVGVEHTLADDTTGGIFEAGFSLSNASSSLVVVELRGYTTEQDGVLRVVRYRTYTGQQTGSSAGNEPHKDFDGLPLISEQGVRITVKQTAGATGIAVPWTLRKIDNKIG